MDVQDWWSTIAPTWLAGAVTAPLERDDYSIIHIGSGDGSTCCELARRFPKLRIYGVDWSRDHVRGATENVRSHDLHSRVEILHSDGLVPPPRLAAGTFDQALVMWSGYEPPSLSGQIRFTLMMLRSQGVLTILMEPKWFTYMLSVWGQTVGNINLFPLWFGEESNAPYVLVKAQKNVQDPLVLHKGIQVGGHSS